MPNEHYETIDDHKETPYITTMKYEWMVKLENKTGTQSIYQYQRVHIIFVSKGSKDGGRLFLR